MANDQASGIGRDAQSCNDTTCAERAPGWEEGRATFVFHNSLVNTLSISGSTISFVFVRVIAT